MNKFTPGPWTVSKRNDPDAPHSIISGAKSGRAYAVAMCPRYRGDDWAEDARLIAAAPDLLDALQDALAAAECTARFPDYVTSRIRDAIAKATGETT